MSVGGRWPPTRERKSGGSKFRTASTSEDKKSRTKFSKYRRQIYIYAALTIRGIGTDLELESIAMFSAARVIATIASEIWPYTKCNVLANALSVVKKRFTAIQYHSVLFEGGLIIVVTLTGTAWR